MRYRAALHPENERLAKLTEIFNLKNINLLDATALRFGSYFWGDHSNNAAASLSTNQNNSPSAGLINCAGYTAGW